MSWEVRDACNPRKFGSAPRKQLIMFLADKASDDGSGIWCSKGTMQRQTELSASTVKNIIRNFVKEGILVKTGERSCRNGFTVVYRIDLARVEALELSSELVTRTRGTADPVLTGSRTEVADAWVPGSQLPPNHSKTIHKPPTCEHVAVEDEKVDQVLSAYPSDRLRDKAACLKRIKAALSGGVRGDDLMQAVKMYAIESADYTRSKVCFSDNWFMSERWRSYVDDVVKGREASNAQKAKVLTGLAKWITDKHPLCIHITPGQIKELLAAKLVTEAQVQAAGLRS